MKKFVIGIDVSKEKLDFCLTREGKIIKECVTENRCESVKELFKKRQKAYTLPVNELLICAEHTGHYTYLLVCACGEQGMDLWLEDPARIKYRWGNQRGKSDKTDARKIAAYARLYLWEARLFSLPQKTIGSLKLLVAERDLYMSDKAKYSGQLTDQKRFMDKDDYERKSKRLKTFIDELEKAIEQIDRQIKSLIDNDPILSRQYKQLCSIDGVGEKTAVKMIVETDAFRSFTDPRKFCCHAGVAPFSYNSGSSQRSKNKVSQKADKSIKALLHPAAMSAATHNTKGELAVYYQRKVEEGKNKMSLLNAVRAKLVHRMFAVIRNNKFYEKEYANALA